MLDENNNKPYEDEDEDLWHLRLLQSFRGKKQLLKLIAPNCIVSW